MKSTPVLETSIPLDRGENEALAGLEDADIAFDPSSTHLDLSSDEKRRVTALFLAINAYRETIIRDADMYREIQMNVDRGKTEPMRPATINAVVEAAIQFDDFISGELQRRIQAGRSILATTQEDTSSSSE